MAKRPHEPHHAEKPPVVPEGQALFEDNNPEAAYIASGGDSEVEIPPAAGSSGLLFDVGETTTGATAPSKVERLAAIVDRHFPYGKNERALSTDVRAVLLDLIKEL